MILEWFYDDFKNILKSGFSFKNDVIFDKKAKLEQGKPWTDFKGECIFWEILSYDE